MKNLTTFLLMALLCTMGALAQDALDVRTDVTVGYSVLSSEDSNFYRNHADLSDGFLLENLKLTAQATSRWFDRIELTAKGGDREDTGRKIRFDIRKAGRYSFYLQETLNFDYFSDDTYNFGANERNAVRTVMNAEFRWLGFRNVTLLAGYGLSETAGYSSQPYSGWLDVYPIRLDRDTSRESFHVGIDFRHGQFKASLRQAWVSIEENSIPIGSVGNAAGETFPSTMTTTRAGINQSDIPTTRLELDYSGNVWWVHTSWSKQDATMDLDATDLKSYLFTDYGSRTDLLSAWYGTGEAPTTRAAVQVSVMPIAKLTVSYHMDMIDTKTESLLATDRSMMLYGTSSTPLVTLEESFSDAYRYENKRLDHGLAFSYKPATNWTIDLQFNRIDGDILQEQLTDDATVSAIDDQYETTHTELGVRYKFHRGTVAVKLFTESIDDPTFRTAGDSKDGISLTGDMALTNRLSATLFVQQAKLENNDPLIQLSDESSVIDLGLHFRPVRHASVGFGITRMELDYATLLLFTDSHDATSMVDGTDTEQTGYYLTGNWSRDRLNSTISLFYMDDSGTSLPLSTWNARMSLSWRFTDTLSALVSLRYMDYSEDATPLHDYNLNQVVFGLRWIYR